MILIIYSYELNFFKLIGTILYFYNALLHIITHFMLLGLKMLALFKFEYWIKLFNKSTISRNKKLYFLWTKFKSKVPLECFICNIYIQNMIKSQEVNWRNRFFKLLNIIFFYKNIFIKPYNIIYLRTYTSK